MKKYVIVLLVGMLLAGFRGEVRGDHEGCMVTGSGAFFLAQCSYVSQSESQSVLVVSPNLWNVAVVREGCPLWEPGCEPVLEDGCLPAPENQCEPRRNANGEITTVSRTIILAEGEGPPPGPPPTVHPRIGETVYVTLDHRWGNGLGDIDGAIDGTLGFIWVGALDGHP